MEYVRYIDREECEERYNVNPVDEMPQDLRTESNIRVAAQNGIALRYKLGGGAYRIYRVAFSRRGYITAVNSWGRVLQDWAGYFSLGDPAADAAAWDAEQAAEQARRARR